MQVFLYFKIKVKIFNLHDICVKRIYLKNNIFETFSWFYIVNRILPFSFLNLFIPISIFIS